MKKVRFESPKTLIHQKMEDGDIQTPRPYFSQQIQREEPNKYTCFVTKPDPLQVFDYSDSVPYLQPQRSKINNLGSASAPCEITVKPSEQLDLSMLDIGSQEPRKPLYSKLHSHKPFYDRQNALDCVVPAQINKNLSLFPCISPLLNEVQSPPQSSIAKDNSFFIRRENLENLPLVKSNFRKHKFLLNNDVVSKKLDMIKSVTQMPQGYIPNDYGRNQNITEDHICFCHHCKVIVNEKQTEIIENNLQTCCEMKVPLMVQAPKIQAAILKETTNICNCNRANKKTFVQAPKNIVDKKKWCIENYEQPKSNENNELHKNLLVTKEKREPTVADLFRIIKLQNEQLQLLQEKVDNFITSSNNNTQKTQHGFYPIQNFVSEKVTLETTENSHQKISIGVMTSFEMIRTSTVINKDVTSNKSAQIQCNRSHISVKEIISQKPVNVNFLDGLKPLACSPPLNSDSNNLNENNNGEKINEFSLCNVQVDNVTTPSLSPEQTMYLDVRDFSGSETNSSNQSNVGWTYYNKVMTHVNGMLQESDMPSSASALFRNTRQHCMQMQIDKTNVSVIKRVTFGEDASKAQGSPVQSSTDTSMKMNQLAAKYLKQGPPVRLQHIPKPAITNHDNMSFATRNYMERHQLLPGMTPLLPYQPPHAPASPIEMPRFLDITALKQQPKLL